MPPPSCSARLPESVQESIATWLRPSAAMPPPSMPVLPERVSTLSGNTGIDGGGIAALGLSQVAIDSCTLSGNRAEHDGGGIAALGQGVGAPGGKVTITFSTLSNNTATYNGGGIIAQYDGAVTITSSVLTDNTAGNWGGGMY